MDDCPRRHYLRGMHLAGQKRERTPSQGEVLYLGQQGSTVAHNDTLRCQPNRPQPAIAIKRNRDAVSLSQGAQHAIRESYPHGRDLEHEKQQDYQPHCHTEARANSHRGNPRGLKPVPAHPRPVHPVIGPLHQKA